jgi:hypothetical protein
MRASYHRQLAGSHRIDDPRGERLLESLPGTSAASASSGTTVAETPLALRPCPARLQPRRSNNLMNVGR